MSDNKNKKSKKSVGSGRRQRSAARLAAVQALYELAVTNRPISLVLQDFSKSGAKAELDEELVPAEGAFLNDVVRGVDARRPDIDKMLLACLDGKPLSRLDLVMRSILRAGAYELIARGDVDAPVVITEYVGIAHAFFSGGEPAIVNGVLDKLAQTARDGDQAEGDLAAEDLDVEAPDPDLEQENYDEVEKTLP